MRCDGHALKVKMIQRVNALAHTPRHIVTVYGYGYKLVL